ncbi:uncharacterized protein LOC133369312 isoform X3 [Rhineura floridana]|uniref:uncharacterized protein LOC133369312 isoform X3 n=1 Tax=Rhineura floridana TaxID=261503 RepID=UPI002AC85779|nr:uncharacterized protein LOC133369312 isoform X3 [Rhineura floridana]
MNRERRSPRNLQPESLDTEDSQTHCNRPCYLDPWIVNLLLEYDESGTGEDGQLGHVLKVLNEGRALHHDEQHPAAVLCIADGHHYIQVDVTTKAVQMSKGSLPQPGFSSIVGQFIVLQNYRVCFKEAAKVEDCQFYLVLDCFRVMPMKRQKMRMQDCNREPSVLEKIKELWQKSFALQPWSSSEPSSVSDVLREIKQDRLSTLKQNAKDCLTLSNPSKLLDSEQLAVYPDTKWQVERKHDKMHQDTFTIPAKLLVISAENEALLCKSYPQRLSRSVPESAQDDDRSTISFFSAESESLDGSLENPWDIFPGMTLSTSSVRRDPSLGPLSENMEVNMEEDHLAHLQRDKVVVREAGEKFLDKDMKCVSAKRKQKVPDEEETFSDPGCTSLKALGQHSAVAFLESSKLEKVAMSKPKKSRIEELQVQQHLVSAQGKKGKEQGATVVILRRPEEQLGVQQRECVAGAPFHITYPPPTSELCSQVRSTRISRALLEWARWVFSSTQKQ